MSLRLQAVEHDGAAVTLARQARSESGFSECRIGLESDALDETMSRIMRSLKAAEFGPVTPAPASRATPLLRVVPR